MQKLASVWGAMDSRRRVIAAGAAIAMFAAVLGLSRMAAAPSMSLLYSGLESSAAGDVVRALEQAQVAYQIKGDAIFVDAAHKDALRMKLAAEGLPAQSAKGYELLDGLSGFGTTSQMFDAAYWRAKEGELARTITASPAISQARVHIASPSSSPFQRNQIATASVTVTAAGAAISPAHAQALKYLVASAVAGLAPEDVAVIDGAGNLISGEDETGSTAAADRADSLRQRVQRLLEARVGHGNAVVEVSVDTVTQSESIIERRFDPEGRVAISTETEERTASSQDSGGGNVTVASNLPDGEAGGSGSSASSQNNETRELTNFEVSETQRQITRQPGDIRRITVAVLVNGTTTAAEDGTQTFAPRAEEEMTALRELVAAAVGFDEQRGDVITLKSLRFEAPPEAGSLPTASMLSSLNLDTNALIKMGILSVVALILGLFVLRPILTQKSAALPAPPPSLPPAEPGEAAAGALTGEIAEDDMQLPELAVISDLSSALDDDGMGGFGGFDTASDDPVERLRSMIGERKEETVEILRSWMEDREETTS